MYSSGVTADRCHRIKLKNRNQIYNIQHKRYKEHKRKDLNSNLESFVPFVPKLRNYCDKKSVC
jgi:hypothetical protein